MQRPDDALRPLGLHEEAEGICVSNVYLENSALAVECFSTALGQAK
jgi:hypothetical protein